MCLVASHGGSEGGAADWGATLFLHSLATGTAVQMVSAFNDVSLFLMLSTQPRPDAEISSVSALGAYSYHTSSTHFLINALLWKLDSLNTRRTQPTTNPSPPYSPILHLAIPWVTDI